MSSYLRHLTHQEQHIHSTSGFTIEITTQENRGVMIAHRVLKVIEEAVDLPQLHVLVFSVPENVVVTDTDTRGMGSYEASGAEKSQYQCSSPRRGSERCCSSAFCSSAPTRWGPQREKYVREVVTTMNFFIIAIGVLAHKMEPRRDLPQERIVYIFLL